MTRLEQLYKRLGKTRPPRLDKVTLKKRIRDIEKIARLFYACGDLSLLQAKELKEKL